MKDEIFEIGNPVVVLYHDANKQPYYGNTVHYIRHKVGFLCELAQEHRPEDHFTWKYTEELKLSLFTDNAHPDLRSIIQRLVIQNERFQQTIIQKLLPHDIERANKEQLIEEIKNLRRLVDAAIGSSQRCKYVENYCVVHGYKEYCPYENLRKYLVKIHLGEYECLS